MPHTWKTTDSARRSGVSDYQRAGIKQTAEFLSADEATVTDLSLQVLYGNKQDPQVNNALSVVTDNLAFNNSSFRDPALRIAVDSSGRAIIGRNIKGPEYGRPDINYSFNIDNCGNMLFKTKDQYITRDTSTNLGFTINDNVGIRKDLYVDGSVDIWDIATLWKGKDSGSQALHVMGSTQMDNQLQFTTGDPCYNIITYIKDGDISTNGIATIGKDLAVGRNVSIGGVITTNVIMKKNLDVCGNTIIDGSLNVGGNTIIDGSLNVSGNTIIDSSLNVGGNTSIGGSTSIGGNTTIGGSTSIGGNTTINGSTSIGGNTTITGGYFHLIDPSANPGSVHNADYNFWVDGSGFYYGNLHVKGNVTYDGSMSVIGTSTVTGDSIIKGDLEVIDDGGTNIGKIFVGTLKSNVSDVTERVIMGIDEHMVTGNKRSISVGHDNTNGNQSEMWFHYDSSGNSNNFGSIGLRGKPTLIAFNNEGKVSIGRETIPSSNFSSLNLPSILDISGTVNITGNNAGGYISQIPSLSINNTSLDDSAGASIELTAKRAYHTESNPGFTPQLTGADIILRNYNDANTPGGASVPTTKVLGVMKTFQTDNSWNRGDMVFYGQDTASINAGTDSSGITEFLRFNSENQFVRFSKDIGIGGNVKPKSGDPVPTSYPSFPYQSAVIDARTYTYYGYENGDNWKAGDILLGCENQDAPISSRKPNGLLWKPLGGHLGPGKVFTGNYSKESAAIKFIPSDDYYRGGLGFFTNNIGDMTTDAVKRMEILSNGDISAVNQTISCKHLNTSTKLTTKSALEVEGVGNRAYFDIVDASRIYFRRSETSTCSTSDEYMYADASGVNVSNNLYVNGEIHGNLAVKYIGNLNNFGAPGNKINILGGLHVAESIDISSNAIIDGSLNVGKNAIIDGSLNVGGNAIIDGTLDVSGNIHMSHAFIDKLNFSNGSNINGLTPGKITFSNVSNVDFNDSDVSNIDNLDISSIRIKAGNINFGSDDKYAINYNSSDSSVDFKTNGNNMMRIFEDKISIGKNISGVSSLLSVTNENLPVTPKFGEGTLIHLGRSGPVSSAANQMYGIGFGTYANANYPPAWIGYEHMGTTSPNGYGDLVFKVKGAGVTDSDPTEVFRIAANGGHVGIGGVKNPSHTLHVDGTGLITGELQCSTITTSGSPNTFQGKVVISNTQQATAATGALRVTGGVSIGNNIYVHNNANVEGSLGVGIGTAGPLYKLDVNGKAMIRGGTLYLADPLSGGGLRTCLIKSNSSQLIFSAGPTSGIEIERIYINRTNGNVGIGESNPLALLHVKGSSRLEGNVDITGALSINSISTPTYAGVINFWNSNGGSAIKDVRIASDTDSTNTNNGALTVSGGVGIEKSLIVGGKVGIGTSSPSAALSVAGSGVSYDKGINMGIDTNLNAGLVLVADAKTTGGLGGISYIDFNYKGSGKSNPYSRIQFDYSNGISFYPDYSNSATLVLQHSGPIDVYIDGETEISGNLIVDGQGEFKNNIALIGGGNIIYMNSEGGARIASDEKDAYIEFTVGGSLTHIMDKNGNVGIGTTIPNNKLDVDGGISAQNCFIQSHSENETFIIMTSMPSTNKQFELRIRDDTTSSYPLHIGPYTHPTGNFKGINIKNSNGNVGINVADPPSELAVNGKISLGYGDSGSTNDEWIITRDGPFYGPSIFSSAGTKTTYPFDEYGHLCLQGRASGGDIVFATSPTPLPPPDPLYTPTVRMVINEYGKVGIGTTSPQAPLEVNGDILVNGGNYGIYLSENQPGKPFGKAGIASSNGGGGTYLEFMIGGTNYHKMDNNGNVGIGTTNPAARLDVNGNAIILGKLTVDRIEDNGANVVTCASNHQILGSSTAYSYNATSDENKKEDIETISDATEKLTSLRGVSYKLKEDKEKKTHYGVVAQELEKVFPDMVHGEEGDKSVAYMEIIGVLIETVKDLNKRIKKLEESSK